MIKRLATLLFALVITFFLVPQSVQAQQADDGIRILRWDVSIVVRSDAGLDIREEQQIQFGDEQYRSGSRSLSVRQFEGLTDVAIFVDGEEYTQSDSQEPGTFYWEVRGPIVNINWFFPETTDTTHTFTILYTAIGAVEFDPGISNRLVWDAIPVDHRRPIDASRVTVVIPQEGEIDTERPPVTYGVESEVMLSDDSVVTFDVGEVVVGQGVRVEVYFALPDSFAIPEPIELPGGDPNSVIGPRALLVFEVMVLLTAVAVAILWRRRQAR